MPPRLLSNACSSHCTPNISLSDISGCVQQIEQTIGGVKAQCERDLQAEASLKAAADAHERAVAERDQTVRRLAAENSLPGFAGSGGLSEAALNRCVSSCCRALVIGRASRRQAGHVMS